MGQIIIEMTSIATFAIAIFGVAFGLMQSKYSTVNRSFALFLTAIALNNVPDAFSNLLEVLPTALTHRAELLIWSPSSLCLAPLFWIYVYTLTSPTQQRPAHVYRHLILPGIAVLIGLFYSVGPQYIRDSLYVDHTAQPDGGLLVALLVLVLLQLASLPQIAVYLFMIVRRLMRHRIMLRDVYASTEEHELRWIYVIGGLGASFLGVVVVTLLFVIDADRTRATPVLEILGGLTGLAMVFATTLWGLRQRPPLAPDSDVAPLPDVLDISPAKPPVEKYEKSSLSAEASARIARKLRAAMQADHLYRDPNLSLWILARHIGASPNYISQTLSEEIGESFFDFVNGYRIAEAKVLLTTTRDTVLMVTYDVGFNARSSFYNAFKRVTGQTPTAYRKTMSQPAGLDD